MTCDVLFQSVLGHGRWNDAATQSVLDEDGQDFVVDGPDFVVDDSDFVVHGPDIVVDGPDGFVVDG